VGVDLLARPGSLARADRTAGLPAVPHPFVRVRNAVADARRTREIVRIAGRHGFGLRGRRNGGVARLPTEDRIHDALEEAGGMFVKLGQLASTRVDLFPPDVIAAFSTLQNHVAPEPPAVMRPLLEEELGAPMDEVFAEFDWSPIAAASIGQVYRATLRTGESVIVKAQRPEVAESVRRDSHVLLRLAGTVDRNTPLGELYRVHDVAQQFTASLERELDFRIEAHTTTAIRDNCADQELIRIPRIYDDYSTARVMVEERLDGVTVAERDKIDALGFDRRTLADALLRSALHQMMNDGLFHADLHPGNVMVLADGTIGLIDFGNTGELDPMLQSSLRHMLVATGLRDATLLRQAVSEIADIRDDVDPDALERALARFMASHVAKGSTIDASAIADLLQLLTDFGIQVPSELTTFSRALVILEGTLGTLCPGYQLADRAQDFVGEIAGRASGASMGELARQEVLGLLPSLRQLPKRADRVGEMLERGTLTTRVSLFSTPAEQAYVTKLVNRLTLGFLGSVLGVIGALLLFNDQGPVLADGTQLLHILGALGLASSFVLILRVIAAIVRDGLN
jgi:ubiquinone biosynthesis protein